MWHPAQVSTVRPWCEAGRGFTPPPTWWHPRHVPARPTWSAGCGLGVPAVVPPVAGVAAAAGVVPAGLVAAAGALVAAAGAVVGAAAGLVAAAGAAVGAAAGAVVGAAAGFVVGVGVAGAWQAMMTPPTSTISPNRTKTRAILDKALLQFS